MSDSTSFEIDKTVNARDSDGVFREAVIERIETVLINEASSTNPSGIKVIPVRQFYVHFYTLDRRHDKWVFLSDLAPYKATKKGQKGAKSVASSSGGASSQPYGMVTRSREKMLKKDVTSIAIPPVEPPKKESPQPAETEPKGQGPVSHYSRTRKLNTNVDSQFFYLPRNLDHIFMGRWRIPTWYYSPYLLARDTVRKGLEELVERQNIKNNLDKPIQLHGERDVRVEEDDEYAPETEDTNEGVGGKGSWRFQSLHLCPFCCTPFVDDIDCTAHVAERCVRHPPGREIYRDPQHGVVMFEICGLQEALFCQNLALLSKLFLEHKSLDLDTSAFVFYVLCIIRKPPTASQIEEVGGVDIAGVHPRTAVGCEVAAYFSKEKPASADEPPPKNNLSCILSLPQYQGRGFGRFLVETSYEISRREDKNGTPETPLSDLGERLYRSVWKDGVLDIMARNKLYGNAFGLQTLSIQSIEKETGFLWSDVAETLKTLGVVKGRPGDQHIFITETQARAHEKQRLERLASGRLCFQRLRLVWNPSQRYLVEPRPHAELPLTNVVAKPPAPVTQGLEASLSSSSTVGGATGTGNAALSQIVGRQKRGRGFNP